MFKSDKPMWFKITIIAVSVLVILALAFGGIYLWMDSFVNKAGNLNEGQNTYSQEELATILGENGEEEQDPVFDQAEDIFKGKHIINILLVGQDRRSGDKPQRTDAMIMCTINQSTKTMTMTSFMRDLWVYIPGHYNQRLNVPYLMGGFDLLNETLDYNFGVSADYNVEIDFAGFMQAVDLIGGLDIELTAAEADYLNERGNWGVDANKDWKLTKGVNHLNGSQALAYSRIRQIGSDFGRTNRQRVVLSTLLEKAKELSSAELYNLAESILPMTRTDMKTPQVLGLIVDMLPMLSDLQIVSQRIPAGKQYSFQKKNGAEVIVLSADNLETNRELLKEAMKEE